VKIAAYDPPQARRYFGNEIVEGAGKAFDITVWIDRRVKEPRRSAGALITIGVDGSRLWDHFPLIATEISTGYQWPLHIWTPGGPGREVSMEAVDVVLTEAWSTWNVWRLYGDPPYIESWLATWAGRWGKDRVLAWSTARTRQMAFALRAWKGAMTSGELTHCAESDRWCGLFTTHVGNAVRRESSMRDDDGGFLWTVEKDRDGSEHKIDSVPAAALSWEARNDAIASGVLSAASETSAYSSYHSLTGEGDELEPMADDVELHGPFVDELDESELVAP
jgi:hypothetical protein